MGPMTRLALFVCGLGLSLLVGVAPSEGWAAAPRVRVNTVNVGQGVTKVVGKLEDGTVIPLDWAQASGVACFPGNHFDAFRGRHVLYRFDLPARSTARLSLKGLGSGDVNLYAYRAAVGEVMMPPRVMGTSCEASYGLKVPGTTPNVGVVEEVELVAIQNPFTIYVGVAGYAGVLSGGFELTVELQTAAPEKTGKVTSAAPVAVEVGSVATIEGRLEGGVEIPLGWAETSNVACFGAHRFKHFEGKHVVYRLDQPAYSTLSVKVTPKTPGLDVSLYVYRVAANDTTSLPPEVHSARCEASYGKRDLEVSPNPGEVEAVSNLITVGNPFGVFIGVAGASGVVAGEYTLEVKLDKR